MKHAKVGPQVGTEASYRDESSRCCPPQIVYLHFRSERIEVVLND